MNINIAPQTRSMLNRLQTEMKAKNIQEGPCNSLYIPAGPQTAPDWKIKGKTDFDRFIKRYELQAVDETGKKLAWTMATRGNEEKVGNVTMIVPIGEDNENQQWLCIQEEARPMD